MLQRCHLVLQFLLFFDKMSTVLDERFLKVPKSLFRLVSTEEHDASIPLFASGRSCVVRSVDIQRVRLRYPNKIYTLLKKSGEILNIITRHSISSTFNFTLGAVAHFTTHVTLLVLVVLFLPFMLLALFAGLFISHILQTLDKAKTVNDQ